MTAMDPGGSRLTMFISFLMALGFTRLGFEAYMPFIHSPFPRRKAFAILLGLPLSLWFLWLSLHLLQANFLARSLFEAALDSMIGLLVYSLACFILMPGSPKTKMGRLLMIIRYYSVFGVLLGVPFSILLFPRSSQIRGGYDPVLYQLYKFMEGRPLAILGIALLTILFIWRHYREFRMVTMESFNNNFGWLSGRRFFMTHNSARIIFCFLFSGILSAAPARAADASAPAAWLNVTSNVGGEKWGYNGVCRLAAVPGGRRIIAGVSEAGLWASDDGGANWSALNQKGSTKIIHRTHSIVFDPKDPKVFWVSGNYGAGIFKTTDGGESFARLGMLEHVDGLAVDLSDPKRATLVTALHEQLQALHLSSDGGATWRKIGDRLPEDSNFCSDTIILSDKLFITGSAGWAQKKAWGILRSEDGGETWKKVSDAGPGGPALVASDGSIYWPVLWKSGLIKSIDRGLTWKQLKTPTTSTPIELPGKRLAAAGGEQVHISTDGGETWQPLGPKLPQKASGIVYSSGLRALFAYRSSEKKIADAIHRLELPDLAGQ